MKRRIKDLDARQDSCLDRRDATVWNGIPCTTVARTLVDLAACLPEYELGRAHQARVLDRTEPEDVEAVLARRPNSKGATEPASDSRQSGRRAQVDRRAGPFGCVRLREFDRFAAEDGSQRGRRTASASAKRGRVRTTSGATRQMTSSTTRELCYASSSRSSASRADADQLDLRPLDREAAGRCGCRHVGVVDVEHRAAYTTHRVVVLVDP